MFEPNYEHSFITSDWLYGGNYAALHAYGHMWLLLSLRISRETSHLRAHQTDFRNLAHASSNHRFDQKVSKIAKLREKSPDFQGQEKTS